MDSPVATTINLLLDAAIRRTAPGGSQVCGAKTRLYVQSREFRNSHGPVDWLASANRERTTRLDDDGIRQSECRRRRSQNIMWHEGNHPGRAEENRARPAGARNHERLAESRARGDRGGKFFEVELAEGASPESARSRLEKLAAEVLANPVIEDYEVTILDHS